MRVQQDLRRTRVVEQNPLMEGTADGHDVRAEKEVSDRSSLAGR